MSRDEERIDEEAAGVERPPRPPSLSSAYLMEAIEHLHDAGDPAHLYAFWRRNPPQDPVADADRMLKQARRERVKAARTSVLFTAFAAESYVNEFLAEHLSKTRFRKVDRWPTPKKYLDATHEAWGERMFFEDREGYPEIKELFALRNKLAHPRPGWGVEGLHLDPTDEFAELFSLPTAARFLTAVGGAADLLIKRTYGYDHLDLPSQVAWYGRSIIRAYAERLNELPRWDTPAERQLFRQAGDYLMAREPLPDHPDATWTRLRKAREERAARRQAAEEATGA